MSTSFRANPVGIEALKRSEDVREILEKVAKEAATEAQGIARMEAYDTGSYHDSIEGSAEIEGVGATGYLNAFDYKANWIEFGYRSVPGKAILRRAMESIVGTTNMRQR